MRKLSLSYDVIDHDIRLEKVNLILLFQVNCPGCFLYGIPLMHRMQDEFKNKVGFVGISTAFEDFDKNNFENTKSLVHNGALVGETAKYLNQSTLENPINFNVVMDKVISKDEAITPDIIISICKTNPNFEFWSEFDQNLLREKVTNYLSSLQHIYHTFTLNHFRGTPTFLIVDDELNIFGEWFGYASVQDIRNKLKLLLENEHTSS
ncbi:hypothetical protein [Fulvivirga lutea]|uniref:Uncharacterized protein n=1 Tax=Fulvivirga lutea TaxID=2810512 RepID=A0A975A014_9BACT|nr:hypothetical protein [Fulvivirga lutea]QSE96341.1 hypothetical protein JR347_12055 [Fulvivirga lutea]